MKRFYSLRGLLLGSHDDISVRKGVMTSIHDDSRPYDRPKGHEQFFQVLGSHRPGEPIDNQS